LPLNKNKTAVGAFLTELTSTKSSDNFSLDTDIFKPTPILDNREGKQNNNGNSPQRANAGITTFDWLAEDISDDESAWSLENLKVAGLCANKAYLHSKRNKHLNINNDIAINCMDDWEFFMSTECDMESDTELDNVDFTMSER